MYLYKSHRGTWAEIDLEAVHDNIAAIKAKLSDGVGIIGVVKADAYGHGAVQIAQELMREGMEYLAISNIDEAIELRNAGISCPLIILGPIEPAEFGKILEFNIFPTVSSLEYARELAEVYRYRGVFAKIHVKVDTGMGRLGIPLETAASEIEQISKLGCFIIDGVFSHFPSSDIDAEYSADQTGRFLDLANELKRTGIKIKHFHIANSAGIFNVPASIAPPFTMVRPGLAIYGYSTLEGLKMRNSMTMKSRIITIRRMKKGDSVSYMRTYRVGNDFEEIAILPVGYADGLPTVYSGKGKVAINGQFYPQVGRICMDYTMVSLGDNRNGVKSGDEAILFGNGGITVEEFGTQTGRIPYEVTCDISKRVPRIYLRKEDNRNV
jgi:alanine racemase